MNNGIHDPTELFNQLYYDQRVHYITVRKAIHIAKSSIYKEIN